MSFCRLPLFQFNFDYRWKQWRPPTLLLAPVAPTRARVLDARAGLLCYKNTRTQWSIAMTTPCLMLIILKLPQKCPSLVLKKPVFPRLEEESTTLSFRLSLKQCLWIPPSRCLRSLLITPASRYQTRRAMNNSKHMAHSINGCERYIAELGIDPRCRTEALILCDHHLSQNSTAAHQPGRDHIIDSRPLGLRLPLFRRFGVLVPVSPVSALWHDLERLLHARRAFL